MSFFQRDRIAPLMAREVHAQFDNPGTAATYLGEAVGTHYSAALRAVEAYGRHLAAIRGSLLGDSFQGDALGNFWKDLMRSEQVRLKSAKVLSQLSTRPTHYFFDFLETADAVYCRRYEDVPGPQKKKLGQTQHAQCLRILRDHTGEGMPDHFALRNRVATWMQMSKVLGAYRD